MRLSEIAAGAAVVCLLLALLTWLLIRGISTDSAEYSATLRLFDEFALAEGSLHRDVLQARAGLLQDYDPLNAFTDEIESVVAQLRSKVSQGGLDVAPVDRLTAATEIEEELTERFKTDNALLRNSLSYVGLLSTDPDFVERNPLLAKPIGALGAAILQLTLDSSAQFQQTVQDRLVELAEQTPVEGPNEATAQAFLAHARLLENLVPSVEDTLKALFAVPTRAPLEETRALFADRHLAAEASAQRYRLFLYATSLLLVVALIDLGRRLRARAIALRKRAAFEHLIAQSSTRLINCPSGETGSRLEQALGDLGRAMGVDRAYVALVETPVRVYSWSVDGSPYPSGWPEAALTLPEQLEEVGLGIVGARDVGLLPPGNAKTTLMTFGVRGWACVPLVWGRARGILGFDTFRPGWGAFFPLAVVRLAGDAIGAAIERELSERDRARLAARLERARRLQMVGQLASGIAHNFNNIIGAILGYSEMAATEIEADARAAGHLAEIQRAAERGRDLIDSILTFGRRSDARTSLVSAPALLQETASLLRAMLPAGVELVVSDSPSDLAVFGEPAQLQQIILNLCKNAAQAMEGSGRICIMADAQQLNKPRALSHGEAHAGRYVRLVVTDNGPGFNEDVARRLFEPFFTTRPGGTGLGLATVREIVRNNDGAMNVTSAPGQGSRFEAWLPAAAGGEKPTATVEKAAPLRLGKGETVLVVHNKRDRLLGDEETVAALGYEPVGFERSTDAVAAVRAERARFDAILISQASVDAALDLARALHVLAPRTPILLATRSPVDIGLEALMRAGVADLVRRPLNSTELAIALCHALGPTATLQAPGGFGV
ncbi:MAG: two-component system VirA-like sensor kinase [Hyphomicrobiales bacterium]|nr:two-component system VirA-like sensor kinase [Hyphomicrobiales bacterium]